jgi:NADH-quinone oxidoreductase subunit E
MNQRYPEGRQKSALLTCAPSRSGGIWWMVECSCNGLCCFYISIQPVEVYEVASFYTMFNLKPVGKCVSKSAVQVPCWLMGAEDVVKYLEKKLNIKEGQTTADGMFSL